MVKVIFLPARIGQFRFFHICVYVLKSASNKIILFFDADHNVVCILHLLCDGLKKKKSSSIFLAHLLRKMTRGWQKNNWFHEKIRTNSLVPIVLHYLYQIIFSFQNHTLFLLLPNMYMCLSSSPHYVQFSQFYWRFELLNRKMGY